MKQRLWILGAQGVLGKTLLNYCKTLRIEAIGTSKHEADVQSIDNLMSKGLEIHATHIINCAAYTDVDGAETNQKNAWEINAVGAQNLAEVCYKLQAKLVHISTDFVFDGLSDKPYTETCQAQPINAYGSSKYAGEKYILNICPTACIVRPSWVFGLNGKNFFSRLSQLLQTKDEMRAIDDQWSRATYAVDLSEAIIHLLAHQGIYHFANAGATTGYEVAQFVLEQLHKAGQSIACQKIVPIPQQAFLNRAPRPPRSILDTEKYTQTTLRSPRHWKEAYADFLRNVYAR